MSVLGTLLLQSVYVAKYSIGYLMSILSPATNLARSEEYYDELGAGRSLHHQLLGLAEVDIRPVDAGAVGELDGERVDTSVALTCDADLATLEDIGGRSLGLALGRGEDR